MDQQLPTTAAAEAETTHAEDISDGEAANTTSSEDQQLQAEEQAPEEPDSAEEAKAPQESHETGAAATGAAAAALAPSGAVRSAATHGSKARTSDGSIASPRAGYTQARSRTTAPSGRVAPRDSRSVWTRLLEKFDV